MVFNAGIRKTKDKRKGTNMKLGYKITSIVLTGALATAFALTGCTEAAENVEPLGLSITVPEITALTALPETSLDEVADDEVVEVVDPATGQTTQMTAAEAKASGKTVVSTGSSAPAATSSGSTQAPSASQSAPAHQHNWVPITTQKYVVDSPAVPRVVCSCGIVFNSQNAWSEHNKSLGRGNGHSYSADSIPEKGHYETITTGYKCSCGATQ